MEHRDFFTSRTDEELKTLFKESVTETIHEQLSLILKKADSEAHQELLTRKQVADIYSVSFVSLRDWEKQGIIPKPLRKGSRVFWRKADVMADISRRGGDNV